MYNALFFLNSVGACSCSDRVSCISLIIMKSTLVMFFFFAKCILAAFSRPFRVLLYGGISWFFLASCRCCVIASSMAARRFCSTLSKIFGSCSAG